jgi:desulfoferrodoxin-like iron-binding protein
VTQLGKRYACPACGAVVLVTSPGDGALECHGQPMQAVQAKPLPASD